MHTDTTQGANTSNSQKVENMKIKCYYIRNLKGNERNGGEI